MKMICVIAALAMLITVPLSVLSAEDGAELFKKCAACHGDKGEGKAPMKMPAVKGTKKTEEQIVTYLMKGESSAKMIHVNPVAGLTEEQAKIIATFVKNLK